jgi:divalent metal cation (Fe/Co/Zn/Cd) transporter
VGRSSINRLRSGEVPEVTAASFAIMITALVVNIWLFSYQRRVGQRLNSEVLIASSADKRSDIMVSIGVLVTLAAVKLGAGWIDAVAALLVVVWIVRNALHIVGGSASVLVDRAALDPEKVRAITADVPGVEQILRVRSRGPSDDIHLDLVVCVAGPTTAEHAAAIAGELRARLRNHFDGLSDIQISFMPTCAPDDGEPDYALIARAEADALGLGVHEVVASRIDNSLTLDMHVEMPPQQTIGEAYEDVERFEERLMRAVPGLTRVVTHIEPAHRVEDCSKSDAFAHDLARQALGIAERLYPHNRWHDSNIRKEADGGYALSMHCYVEEDMPLERAHHLAESVETQVRAKLPSIHRVTIHTEPLDVILPQRAQTPNRTNSRTHIWRKKS